MKRGQITIFIIVGTILLFILGFAIYMIGLLQPPEPELETGPTFDASGCLERTAEYVLLTTAIGSYEPPQYMGSSVVLPPDKIFDATDITKEEYQKYTDPPYEGQLRFGTYEVPPLCLRTGVNRPDADGTGWSSCMSGTYQLFETNENVIQSKLEQELNHALSDANCTVYGHATVVLGTDDVTIITKNATAVVPMRYKRMHNAAVRIVQEDIKKIEYDLSKEPQVDQLFGCDEPGYGNICILPEMTTSIEHAKTVGHNHNFSIVDRKQLINGEYPIYRFTIANRKPIIIDYPNKEAAGNYAPRESHEIKSEQGERERSIGVKVVDPDDEPLTVVCKEKRNGNYYDLPLDNAVAVECTEEGIFFKVKACVREDYDWGVDVLHYSACEKRVDEYGEPIDGECVSIDVQEPRVRLSTDRATANACCARGAPGQDWCCMYQDFEQLNEPKYCCDNGLANSDSCCRFDIDYCED